MLNLKYKAYNNRKLKRIHRNINTAGCIWNHIIALQKRYYKLYGKHIGSNRMQKHIAKLRKNNVFWLQLNSQTVQEICQRVEIAYLRFFKKLAKHPPGFKKIKKFNSFILKQSGWKIKDNILIINNIKYKFIKSRNYKNIKRISVKRNKLGEIFFVLTCDIQPNKYERLGNSSIGIDFGLKTYITCSDGKEIISPEFFKQNLTKLKAANRNLSRKKKGSNNRKKALKELQRLHIKISNQRKDFQWKLAHELCKNSSFIAIENLNIEAMKRLWGRKISDLAHSSFIDILKQVVLKYDTIIQEVGRFYPSSKTCTCGYINKDLKLSDRTWICLKCGILHDRDKLAAKNIKNEGIRLYRTKFKTSSEAA